MAEEVGDRTGLGSMDREGEEAKGSIALRWSRWWRGEPLVLSPPPPPDRR